MCGIFAYHGPAAPDPGLLAAAAVEAGRRGPHGHGWVIRHPDGTLAEHRQLGQLNGDLRHLQAAPGPVLGHARLATFGSSTDPGCFQPVVAAGHALAHNGNVYNAAELAAGTATDTHALAAAYALLRGAGVPPGRALAAVLDRAEQTSWAIVILDAGGSLLAHRHYHPLYVRTAGDEVYLSSRPFHRACKLLPDSRLVTLADGR